MKEIYSAGSQTLTVGHVYFDKNIREVIYDISFPQHYRFAVTDFGVVNDSTKVEMDQKFTGHLVDFSIFNLVLSGKLNYFGLDNSAYQMINVTHEDSMVISEWKLPVELGSDFGKMLVSQKNKRLFGLVSFNKDDQVISKQFFTNYVKVGDLEFPTKLLQINYGEVTFKKITTFRNITINEPLDENYRFND